MKASGGKANPGKVNELLKKKLGSGQVALLARRAPTVKRWSPGTRARLGALGVGAG